jgi:hypothetical protein
MLAASRLSIPTEERQGKAVGSRQCQGPDEGLPVHSFQSLLGDLATITRNIMALNDQSDATKLPSRRCLAQDCLSESSVYAERVLCLS